jgi:cell division protein FtsA
MDTTRNTAGLEITSDTAKFAIGYEIGGVPVLLYYAERPIKGLLKDGQISNPTGISQILTGFLRLEDEAVKLKINAVNVSIVVPPLGFQVYQNNKTTNVVASNGLIDKLDVSNVMSLVMKEAVPNGNVIVDIVPDAFLLDSGKAFSNPPLGEKSNSLTIQAKVHTLPEKILYDYRRTVEGAGFRVKRSCVATYCASQLIASDKSMPSSYIYIDIGAHITTVSLIGNAAPYGSLYFPKGGDDLTDDIAESLSINPTEAKRLKEDCGYDLRKSLYQAPVAVGKGEDDKNASYYQKDLNTIIESFFEGYVGLLANAIAQLVQKQPHPEALSELPLLVSGGGSKLKGIDILLIPALGKRKLVHFVPKVIGARNEGAVNLLGLILAESVYRGTLEDNYHGVSTLSRDR